jgi:hypothetical protein
MWLDGAHPIAAPPAGLASRRGAPASGTAARRNPNAADGEADGMMEQCAAHDDVARRGTCNALRGSWHYSALQRLVAPRWLLPRCAQAGCAISALSLHAERVAPA